MTISKSLPIQFWLTSEYTYNEAEICGVYPDCFCEHVNFDEYITLQFTHSTALTLKAYKSSDDTLLRSLTIPTVGSNLYQIRFQPNRFILSNTEKVIYFKIFAGATELARSGCVVIGGCVEYPIIPVTPPATATLTFSPYTGGLFRFTLSVPIFDAVIISDAKVVGSQNTNCTGSDDTDTIDNTNQLIINPGETTSTVIGTNTILNTRQSYRRIDLINVNGLSKDNGDTITIGGTVVTIVINSSCITPYIP